MTGGLEYDVTNLVRKTTEASQFRKSGVFMTQVRF